MRPDSLREARQAGPCHQLLLEEVEEEERNLLEKMSLEL
jgi:hypothetical protein